MLDAKDIFKQGFQFNKWQEAIDEISYAVDKLKREARRESRLFYTHNSPYGLLVCEIDGGRSGEWPDSYWWSGAGNIPYKKDIIKLIQDVLDSPGNLLEKGFEISYDFKINFWDTLQDKMDGYDSIPTDYDGSVVLFKYEPK